MAYKLELNSGLEHFDSEDESDYSLGSFNECKQMEDLKKKQIPVPIEQVDFDKLLREDYKGVLIKYDKNSFDKMSRPIIVMLLPFYDKNEAYLKKWTDILYKIALKHEAINYVLGDFCNRAEVIKSKSYEWDYNVFTTIYNEPLIYAIDEQQRKFQFDGARTIESISNFSEDLLNGKLYLSENIPPLSPTEPLVKKAVANNFEQLVMQSDKNVFITFYASWCCLGMELLPKLEEMAQMLINDDILFIKMDSELNYIPLEFTVFTSPKTIYMPKMNKMSFIDYDGDARTVENLMKFIVKCNNISNNIVTQKR